MNTLPEHSDSPKISVIVPVYKVEKYLSECIESVLAQTFTDFELILVDDGSPDNSGKICDEYAKKDSRIRVFHKENGGVSSARNLGLDNARGEWICFFDADDWIDNTMLKSMFYSLKNEGELCICGFSFHKFNRTREVRKTIHTPNDQCGSIFGIYTNLFLGGFINSPCNKMFSSFIIRENSLRFKNGIGLGEDTIFVTEYFDCIKRIQILDKVFYHVRRGFGERATTRYHDNILNVNSIFENALNKLCEHSLDSERFFYKDEILKMWFWTIPAELAKKECPLFFCEKRNILIKMLRSINRNSLSDIRKHHGIIQKVYFVLLYLKSPIAIILCIKAMSCLIPLIRKFY